jgi:hypothetical protein
MKHEITLSDGSVKVVHTTHDCPPIPVRNYDWCAYGDDYDADYADERYVGLAPVGYGATEQEAISAYVMQLEGNE